VGIKVPLLSFFDSQEQVGEICKMRSKYATVKIPQDLATRLDEFVSDMGYRSRAEIVNDAIRRFIDERKRLDYSSTVKDSEGAARDLKRNEIPKLTPVTR